MKLCIIQCHPYLSHAQSRNFAWHLLWLSTTEGKNIDKLLAISQTPSILQTDRQTDLPSNFLKIARLLGKIKHTVSLRFIILYFGAKNRPLGTYGPEEKPSRRVLRGQLFSKGKNWNYLVVCFTQFTLFFSIRLISIADLFAVCYLWDVFNEDKCCVVTHRAADILVASLGLFTWVAYVRKYCVPITTLNPNKRSWLLYLGDAQIIILPCESTAEKVLFE